MNDDPPDPLHLRNIAGWAMAVDFISIRASAINRDQRLGEEGNRYVILQSQGKNVSCDRSSDCTNRLIQTLPAVAAREDTGSAQSYQVRRGGPRFLHNLGGKRTLAPAPLQAIRFAMARPSNRNLPRCALPHFQREGKGSTTFAIVVNA